jgi:inhibitor of cysteine peptidase
MTRRVLDEHDSERIVDCSVGDEFVVRLPETPTTGYRWEPVDLPGMLELVGDSFDLAQSATFGSGGVRQLTFVCRDPGESDLQLRHWQVWEGEASVDRVVSFRMRVADL